jgi:hypothetical protein
MPTVLTIPSTEKFAGMILESPTLWNIKMCHRVAEWIHRSQIKPKSVSVSWMNKQMKRSAI